MLQIFYTGADSPFAKQTDPSKSLGGYVSKSLIPNSDFSNLFGEISQLAREKKSRNIRVIAIKNTSNIAKTGLSVYINPNTETDVKFQLGFQDPDDNLNECKDVCGEKVANQNALPHTIIMSDVEGVANKITLPDLDTGAYMILYITREIINGIQSYSYEQLLEQEENPLATFENPELIFEWD